MPRGAVGAEPMRGRRVSPRPPSAARILGRRLGVLAAIGVAAWAVWWSPLFALDSTRVTVAVDGALVSSSDVAHALVPFDGTPLTRLSLPAVEAAVAAVPGVRIATATKDWPHGLSVTVTVRVPVAAIADSGSGYILVDIDGVHLASVADPPTDVPVLTVPVGAGNERVLAAALAVAGALPKDLAARVEGVRAETEDSVTLFLRDGPRVEWGSAEQTDLKIAVLRTLLNSDAAQASVIDVSAPTLPVTRD